MAAAMCPFHVVHKCPKAISLDKETLGLSVSRWPYGAVGHAVPADWKRHCHHQACCSLLLHSLIGCQVCDQGDVCCAFGS